MPQTTLGYFDVYTAIGFLPFNALNPSLREPDFLAVKVDFEGFGGLFEEGGLYPDVILGIGDPADELFGAKHQVSYPFCAL